MIPAHPIQSNLRTGLNETGALRNKLSKSQEKIKRLTKDQIVLFVVDDDALYTKALTLSISRYFEDVAIYTFQTGEACLHQLNRKPDIVILDYYLDSEVPYAWNGMSILKQIKRLSPDTRVVMLSAQDSLNVAMECVENGAYDYVSKTQSAFVRLNNILDNILEYEELKQGDKTWQMIALIITFIILIFILLNH